MTFFILVAWLATAQWPQDYRVVGSFPTTKDALQTANNVQDCRGGRCAVIQEVCTKAMSCVLTKVNLKVTSWVETYEVNKTTVTVEP